MKWTECQTGGRREQDSAHHDERWRIVAMYEDDDTAPTEQFWYHNAGASGLGGSSYIDDVVLRDRDTDANGTLDERRYYLQNQHHDVVALINTSGSISERVNYDPYGSPIGTFTSIANRKGYAGYEYDAQLGDTYHVRHRVYRSDLGVWTRRDPLGYVDGMGLYEYARGDALGRQDPDGLATKPCPALKGCKDIRRRPRTPPSTPNGCGSSGISSIVPEYWWICFKPVVFTQCCNSHDSCYSTCGKTRHACDVEFLQCLTRLCDFTFKSTFCNERCYDIVRGYYEGVDLFGCSAYKGAQTAACICCDPPSPDPLCAGTRPLRPTAPVSVQPGAVSLCPNTPGRRCTSECPCYD